jgi:hypothetical protein
VSDIGLELIASFGEHLHPAARLVTPDEAVDVLEVWIESAFKANKPGDCERFCFLVELRERLMAETESMQ